jgi:hypothetical protein
MKDVELVRGDDEADAMLACAVMYVMHEEIVKVIDKFARLVPPGFEDEFIDYLYERTFLPSKPGLGEGHDGSPDLMGDEAYREYVRKVMEVK